TRSLLRSDPEAEARAEELARVFGSEDLLMVAWEVESAVDADEFERLDRITAALDSVEGLEEIYSIASPRVPLRIGNQLRPVSAEDLRSEQGCAAVREGLLASPVYLGTIYNDTLDVVAVAGTMRPGSREAREGTLQRVRTIAHRFERPGRPMHVAGVTALAVDASEYAYEDLRRIGLLALAVSVAVLFALRRSVRETFVAVLATGLPPLYALGLAAALGAPVTALGAALFPVMAVVGITSSVHLLNAYGEEREKGRAAGDAARRAARRLAPPIALSLLTTAAAFVSLQATGVPAFRGGGFIVALGLLFAVPVILLGLPAALALAAPRTRVVRTPVLDRLLVGVGWWSMTRRRAVIALGILLCAGGAVAASRAALHVDVLQAFQPESRIARTYRFLDERLTATLPVDVVLRAYPGVEDKALLEDLERFTDRVKKLPWVDSVLSLGSLVRYGRSANPVPVGDEGALLILRSLFAPITRRFEDREGHRYRVKIRIREGAPPEVLDGIVEAASEFETGEAEATGLFVRAVATTRSLAVDLAKGALLMTAVVFLAVSLALRSWRLGLASLLPNLLPPAVVFGCASALGVRLDVSAVAVGAVAIGLAVDDTLHLLFRVAEEGRSGRTASGAMLRAQRSVGRALVISTVVLVAGLACLLSSNFLPTARFGLFAAAASAVALLSDLCCLPALVRALRV
ncbi:MAG: efflux RND transporter permease subunit, partial [Planctomycetota bacterium]